MQIQKFDKLNKIQIVLDQSGNKWVGIFEPSQIPQNMQLDKFGDFVKKCYLNESNCRHQIISQTDSKLVIRLEYQMEFFTLSHELELVKHSSDLLVTRELIENVTKLMDSKLNKMITLVDLRKFEPIIIKYDNQYQYQYQYQNQYQYQYGLESARHRIEFELSEKINDDKQTILLGYESSIKIIDLSAYPYEYIDWNQINNFYNLEEMIINGQTDYKFCSATSNLLDESIFLSNIISIGTINPNLRKLSINNIYRVDGDLGYLDWAPNLEELTLIGCKGKIEIIKFIKRNTKLKKINLINCVERIIDPVNSIKLVCQDFPITSLGNTHNTHKTSIENLFDINTKWQELKAWCQINNIELNLSDYVEDKDTNSYNFPFLEYRGVASNMYVSGFRIFSIDTVGSNDINTNKFASCI